MVVEKQHFLYGSDVAAPTNSLHFTSIFAQKVGDKMGTGYCLESVFTLLT